MILHTRAGTGSSLFNYFNGPSGGVESHMYLTFDGKWEQYRDTSREADANLKGNSFVINGKRYGFLSVETEGNADDDWTPTQLAEIKEFIAWASKIHGFPLRVCPAWDKAGVGYHTMWGAPGPWTPVAKSCPGPKRIKQFNSVIVPWLKNPTEDELPFSLDDIAHAVWAYDQKGIKRQAWSYLQTADANARTAAGKNLDLDKLAAGIASRLPSGGAPGDQAAVLSALREFFSTAGGDGK